MTRTDDLLSLSLYLTEIYHTFRCEIPHINHPKLVSDADTSGQHETMKTNQPRPHENPSTSTNQLLMKKSMLKPVPQPECKKAQTAKTVFDYWLTQNKILMDNEKTASDRCSTDGWSSVVSRRTVKKKRKRQRQNRQLKYYDEHFREVSPNFQTSVSSPEMSSAVTAPVTKVPPELDVNEPVLKTSQSSVNLALPERDMNESVPKISQSSIDLSRKSKESIDDVYKVKIRLIKQNSYNKQLSQTLSFDLKRNALYVSPKIWTKIKEHDVPRCLRDRNYQEGLSSISRNICHTSNNLPYLNVHQFKFLFKANMSEHNRFVPPEQIYERVVDWLSSNDFQKHEVDSTKSAVDNSNDVETNLPDGQSDITSITKVIDREEQKRQEDHVEEVKEVAEETQVPKTTSEKTVLTQDSSDARLQAVVEKLKNNVMVNSLKKITNLSSWQLYNSRIKSSPKAPSIPTILEKDELVCFPLYTFTPLLFFYLLFTKYNHYLIFLLFCPY